MSIVSRFLVATRDELTAMETIGVRFHFATFEPWAYRLGAGGPAFRAFGVVPGLDDFVATWPSHPSPRWHATMLEVREEFEGNSVLRHALARAVLHQLEL